jgi:HD-GYP domain-containing protein (c-di-GMP phosphodiesterase class II)
MRLGKKIYSEEGKVLLTEKAELTQPIIDRLRRYGILYLYIVDPQTDDIVVNDPISDETRQRVMSEIRYHFRRIMMESVPRKSVRQPFFGKAFKEVLGMIIDDVSQNPNAMIMLTDLSITDLYLYRHSLNVCIYATVLGIASGYSTSDLAALGLGGLLHDIGKTKIPIELLNKPGPLRDSEIAVMKTHTDIGFKLLKDEPNIPLSSAHCALQHHERLDGSGYPRGIRGGEIHEFAKWIALIDAYDAMTSYRCYRPGLLPHQAIDVLSAEAGKLFDERMLDLFRKKVAIYPIGITVELSTGESGVVVDLNSNCPERPVVRILQDADGREVRVPYEIDLSNHLSVTIAKVNQFRTLQNV